MSPLRFLRFEDVGCALYMPAPVRLELACQIPSDLARHRDLHSVHLRVVAERTDPAREHRRITDGTRSLRGYLDDLAAGPEPHLHGHDNSAVAQGHAGCARVD